MRESFRFYRNLDIDFSFHFKDKGKRVVADNSLPVVQHEHRVWNELAESGARRAQPKELPPLPRQMGRPRRPPCKQPAGWVGSDDAAAALCVSSSRPSSRLRRYGA